MTPECRHIKTSGGKCASPAMHDRPFCYYHWRQRERASERRTSPAVPLSHALSNLEDRGAIQHAITQVIMALADYEIDTKRAGVLLYGLQLASSNAKDAEQIVSSSAIAELTHTEEGEEMAPEGSTSRPQQEETLADVLLKAVVTTNPGIYEEYVPGQGLRRIENKDLNQKPGGEGGTPPPKQMRVDQLPALRIDDEEEDPEEDGPELLSQWPLDEFGHPKPRWN
jgi:hypothetical protein